MKWTSLLAGIIATLAMHIAHATPSITIPMYLFDPKGQPVPIGTVKAEAGICGVLLTPDLHDLSPGVHGFHIHENPSCENGATAAGGHLDPIHAGMHHGPYRTDGHLGDLPALIVNQDGKAMTPTLAPRFKLADLKGHSLIIHAGGDNYADTPEKLGGGGARIACGVIGEITQ